MEEEEYLQSLQPMLPTGPVYLDNAVTSRNVPDAQRSVYDAARSFGRGQAAARLLKRGQLKVTGSHDPYSFVATFNGRYRGGDSYIAAHFPDETIRRVDEDTPISDTMGADSFAVINRRHSPIPYFEEGNTWVRNKVGIFDPDLDGYRDIDGVPEEDKRNAYAHQIINGLRSTLRQSGVTDEDLRSIGIDGLDGLDADSLEKLRRDGNGKIYDLLTHYLGQGVYDHTKIREASKKVSNFLRANYRPGVYHVRPEGVPERTRLYANGGPMPKASPERIRHEGRVLARVGGNEREDWYL